MAADLRGELEPLYAFVLSRVGGNQTVAEDLTQETLLAAVQTTFDASRGTLRAWLFGIALRKIADYVRRKAISKRHLEDAARDLAVRMIREPLPMELLQREEVRAVVTDALSRLPESMALLLIRKYFDGATVAELAIELSGSEKAIESQLTRARAAFHEAVQRFGQE
ncbi:MAG TPA: sigma-70 family RNA polymerase sigma factor [Dongiaceae bacterium]|nr:sigma-70 family RNA polymerase sigma factor [Dongiaceae bacterium]